VKIVKAGHNGPTQGKGSGIQFGTGTTQDTAGSIYGTPHRASGGPVIKGHPYIVAEHRSELFIPDRSGYIEPRTDLAHRHKRHARNGGGPADSESLVVNVNVNGALSTKGEIAQAVKNALETNLNGGGTLTVRSGAIRTRH
jgi:hypothetical protein